MDCFSPPQDAKPLRYGLVFMGCRAGIDFDIRAPFFLTDGGRSLSRRPKQKNDCTVRALAIASGADYDLAYDTLAAAGRKCAKGFHFREWAKSAEFNGYHFEWFACPAVKGQWRTNPVTFAQANSKGRFVLRLSKHVMACVDGSLFDAFEPHDPHRCVYGAWRLVKGEAA